MNNSRKFLLMVNEQLIEHFVAVFPGLEFLEVAGVDVENNNDYKLIVNPKLKQPEPMDVDCAELVDDVVVDTAPVESVIEPVVVE